MFSFLTGSGETEEQQAAAGNGEGGEKPQALSHDEEESAKEMMAKAASTDDDFKDAVADEDDVDTEKTFEVTSEELAIIRAELATEFPDDYNYLSDAYILSVASKPYSKDPTVRRPLEVSLFLRLEAK